MSLDHLCDQQAGMSTTWGHITLQTATIAGNFFPGGSHADTDADACMVAGFVPGSVCGLVPPLEVR